MTGYIYALRFRGGWTKIGFTMNPKQRLADLKSKPPFQVCGVRVFTVKHVRPLLVERAIHEKFKERRMRGKCEWFKLTAAEFAWFGSVQTMVGTSLVPMSAGLLRPTPSQRYKSFKAGRCDSCGSGQIYLCFETKTYICRQCGKETRPNITMSARRSNGYRGLQVRVARQLGCSRTHVSLVARGLRTSKTVLLALAAEVRRIEKAK